MRAIRCLLSLSSAALALGLLLAAPASAQVWKYVDDQGVTHFTNEPVAQGLLIIAADPKPANRGPADLGPLPEDQALRTLNFVESQASYKDTQAQLMAAAQTHGLDYALVKAVTATESAFNPNAISHKGAVGLMQIMPATAAQYGVRSEPGVSVTQKLKVPDVNIQVGTRLLADLFRLYPDRIDLVLAAYNAGQGAVSRAGHQIPNFRETQHYVRKVLAVYKVLKSRS
ncbi:transglycosylase SLT domain-containing protein [Limnohabitans sp.]|uniref:transglycosylase SLT domain-containing protein n=1 Tax=Limnohabitans sp. TaxID=1907725 RepID=UPI0025C121C6|nr:transglycosylase SLT domain-containing protein [Limnohabitans sp.]